MDAPYNLYTTLCFEGFEMSDVDGFLGYVRAMVAEDPGLCPCDPEDFGACMAFLGAMREAYAFSQVEAAADASSVRPAVREMYADGLRSAVRSDPV
jgi:hypothetical protein